MNKLNIKSGIKLEPHQIEIIIQDAASIRSQILACAEMTVGTSPGYRVFRSQLLRVMSDHNGYLNRLSAALEVNLHQSEAV